VGGVGGTYDGLEVLLLMLVVLVAEVDELLLEGVLELLEGLDGLVLGGVRGIEVDGLCGGLCVYTGELLALVRDQGARSHDELVTPLPRTVTCEAYHFGFRGLMPSFDIVDWL